MQVSVFFCLWVEFHQLFALFRLCNWSLRLCYLEITNLAFVYIIGAETADLFQELSLGSDANEVPRNRNKVLNATCV